MKQIFQSLRDGTVALEEVPAPALRSGGVLVRNRYSLISAGTERQSIETGKKSLLGKAKERPDLVRQVIDKARREGLGPTYRAVVGRLEQPSPLGYSCAGVVLEAGDGAGDLSPGTPVACAGAGYASHAEFVFVPKNLCVPLPEGMSLRDGAFVTLGAISLQGVRRLEPTLGEWVVVVGLGLLGQLAVSLLRAHGCRVIGVDLDPGKVALARERGADAAVVRSEDVAALVASRTGGVGADGVVITASANSNDPTELAIELARMRGRVVVVGAVTMDVPRRAFYDKELDLRISRSYGPGRYDPEYEERGHDYPIGWVRWTEKRNMEAFLALVADGRLDLASLVSHTFPIARGEEAYALLTSGASPMAVLLEYPEDDRSPSRVVTIKKAKGERRDRPGIALIGAGNFAASVLAPAIAACRDVERVGIAAATGTKAVPLAKRFGFAVASTDYKALLDDGRVHAAVIATRHAQHPEMVIESLARGRDVFVEKPLAIDDEGLDRIVEAAAARGGRVMVGFNRRFAPMALAMRDHLRGSGRLTMLYRVNAGSLPAGSWIEDPAEGGGRVVGEVCHFVDFLQFLSDARPIEVHAWSAGGERGSVTIALRFSDGSTGTIVYATDGDPSLPKERCEVFGGGKAAVLDDFRALTLHAGRRASRTKSLGQDKGHRAELDAFFEAVRSGGPMPIPLESSVLTTRVTFAIHHALETGLPVPIA